MKLYSYDISSAYPSHASRLFDLRDCTIRHSTDLDLSAAYGFLTGDFTVYPDHPLAFCSPFLTDRGDGMLVNFSGTVRNYPCLLDEVRTLVELEMGEFTLSDGWFVYPSVPDPRRPFKELMDALFKVRSEGSPALAPDPILARNGDFVNLKYYIVKRVMTGIVGKLLEARRDGNGNVIEYGQLYNPIYHALCTTRTRLQVFRFIVENRISQSELVHVGVDGIKATKHIPLPSQAPMGEWRCSGSEPTFVLSPGAIISPHRNFKQTSFGQLLVECLNRPTAYRLGDNSDVDLRRLFSNQNRRFPKLPHNAQSLLEEKYRSEPVVL